MTWHVDVTTVERYWNGRTDAAVSASVEAHLLACEQCRTTLNATVDDAVLDTAWHGIVDDLDTPRLGWIERLLLAIGCSVTTGRIVAATTRARFAFVVVVAFNVLVAIASSSRSGEPDSLFLAFLLLAPLGPLVATCGAFGRWTDPAHAVLRTVPTPTARIVLIRVVAGVVPAVLLTAVALPWLADRGWLALAWLMPALALALVTLALSTWIDVELAGVIVGGLWIALPVALRLPVSDLIDLFAGPVQLASSVTAAAAVMTAIARRSKLDYREI
jgi:hypothetical protein